MLRHPYRASIPYFGLYFALGLLAINLPKIASILGTDAASTSGGYGFSSAIVIYPSLLETILPALAVGLMPTIGSIAGVALSARVRTPRWGLSVLFAVLSLIPVVAFVAVLALHAVLIEGFLADPESPADPPLLTVLTQVEVAIAIAWLLAPVVLTRQLYRREASALCA